MRPPGGPLGRDQVTSDGVELGDLTEAYFLACCRWLKVCSQLKEETHLQATAALLRGLRLISEKNTIVEMQFKSRLVEYSMEDKSNPYCRNSSLSRRAVDL
jgi:hypothetical protein